MTAPAPEARRRTAVGLADLAWLLGSRSDADAGPLARALGFAPVEEERPTAPPPTPPAPSAAPPAPAPEEAPAPAQASVPFWYCTGVQFSDAAEDKGVQAEALPDTPPAELTAEGRSLLKVPPTPPLAPWARLWPALAARLRAWEPGARPDLRRLVGLLSRGQLVRRIPRRPRPGLTARLEVWLDLSQRLVPFWADGQAVVHRLERLQGAKALTVRPLTEPELARAFDEEGQLAGPAFRVAPDAHVLLLSDLGAYAGETERAGWQRTARRLTRAGTRLTALVPVPPCRLARSLAERWHAVPWEQRRARLMAPPPAAELRARAEALLRLLAPAVFVEPGLLRALRRLLPAAAADAGTEADVWAHPDVSGTFPGGLVLHRAAAARLRREFAAAVPPAQDDPAGQAARQRAGQVAATLHWFHADLPAEIRHAETAIWQGLGLPADIPGPGDPGATAKFFDALVGSAVAGALPPGYEPAVTAYAAAAGRELTETAYRDATLGRACNRLWALVLRQGPVALPAGVDPATVLAVIGRGQDPRTYGVRQVGAQLHIFPSTERWDDRADTPGSPLAWLRARAPHVFVEGGRGRGPGGKPLALGEPLPLGDAVAVVELQPRAPVTLRADLTTVRLDVFDRLEPPAWATAAGRDRHGLWAELELTRAARYRFRWIPPGRFMMGSPKGEAGGFGDERPQHEVTLAEGFWLGETPVTQALWQAVMDDNPSRFKTPDRPVEEVSWDDCRAFADRLNKQVNGLHARPPSEAEWEYACRAGTTAATWIGDLEILGEHNAPLLDPIAWYGGNSGRGFELENGYDTSDWQDKQYPDTKAGTHPVGQKAANPWGLRDMLGNVWEWCADDWHGSFDGAPGDGQPWVDEPRGSGRVRRGGSWGSLAGIVRAACRRGIVPGYRDDGLGVRLARGQRAALQQEAGRQGGRRVEPPAVRGPGGAEPAGPRPASTRDAARPASVARGGGAPAPPRPAVPPRDVLHPSTPQPPPAEPARGERPAASAPGAAPANPGPSSRPADREPPGVDGAAPSGPSPAAPKPKKSRWWPFGRKP